MPETKAYTAEKIFTGENWLTGHAVLTDGELITGILPISDLPPGKSLTQFDEAIIAPAFIDIQVYGAGGMLLAEFPNGNALQRLATHGLEGGTVLCLPTVATNEKPTVYKCIDAVKEYWKNGGKGIGGLHLEGPWLNPAKRGAHIRELIHPPTKEEVNELLSYGKGVIKMITLAPEVCSDEIISLLLSNNVILSAGHSDASYEQAREAFSNGVGLVTHLYNAMSPLQHRAPGLVGAAFDDLNVSASIIPDGHHSDWAAIRIASKIMGERLFAITDAVTETETGYYPHKAAGDKYESAGVLSGSSLSMAKALYNLVHHCDITAGQALRMCSWLPAKAIGLGDKYGRIEAGYYPGMVVLNRQMELIQTIH